MRITLQLPLKAHLGQNLLVFKKEDEQRESLIFQAQYAQFEMLEG